MVYENASVSGVAGSELEFQVDNLSVGPGRESECECNWCTGRSTVVDINDICVFCNGEFDQCEINIYQYINSEVPGEALLYASEKQISFMSSNGRRTHWHGSFRCGQGTITARFNYCGDTKKMRMSYLHCIGSEKYEGFDDAGRQVTMKLLKAYRQFCPTCSYWQ